MRYLLALIFLMPSILFAQPIGETDPLSIRKNGISITTQGATLRQNLLSGSSNFAFRAEHNGGASLGAYALQGISTAAAGSLNYGVFGQASGANVNNYGGYFNVLGDAGTLYGVYSDFQSGSPTTAYGGYFNASGTATTQYGIYASAANGGANYAGFFNGQLRGELSTSAATAVALFKNTTAGSSHVLQLHNAGDSALRLDFAGNLGQTGVAPGISFRRSDDGGLGDSEQPSNITSTRSIGAISYYAYKSGAYTQLATDLVQGFDTSDIRRIWNLGVGDNFIYDNTGLSIGTAANATSLLDLAGSAAGELAGIKLANTNASGAVQSSVALEAKWQFSTNYGAKILFQEISTGNYKGQIKWYLRQANTDSAPTLIAGWGGTAAGTQQAELFGFGANAATAPAAIIHIGTVPFSGFMLETIRHQNFEGSGGAQTGVEETYFHFQSTNPSARLRVQEISAASYITNFELWNRTSNSDIAPVLFLKNWGSLTLTDITGNFSINSPTSTRIFHSVLPSTSAATNARFETQSTATAIGVSVLDIMATSTGSITNGFGPVLNFYSRDNSGVDNQIGQIYFLRSGGDAISDLYLRNRNAAGLIACMLYTQDGRGIHSADTNGQTGLTSQTLQTVSNSATRPASLGAWAVTIAGGATIAPHIHFRRTKNTTASPTAFANGDYIGYTALSGHDGSGYDEFISHRLEATETWSGTANGFKQVFSVVPSTTTTAIDVFTLANSTFRFSGSADTDLTFDFIGTTNSGQFLWMEDENYFQYNDSIKFPDSVGDVYGTGDDVSIVYDGTNWIFNVAQTTTEIIFNEGGLDTNFRIESDTSTAALTVDGGTSKVGVGITTGVGVGLLGVGGDLSLEASGSKIHYKEGANPSQGVATLVGGTVTVSTTAVSATSRVWFTRKGTSTAYGNLRLGTITAGTSFVIDSDDALDDGQVQWQITDSF